ncbi:MAG: hypothetical protein BGO98_10335 [Myxococcales bacterium 68-20]|nr:hypothetical protein [Myxococcales bacterium]OJY18048.1 MAG: hypothetical protein BGO98_10335 [Myxococcales bacterium 68-20]
MDVRTELEQDPWPSEGIERSESVEASASQEPSPEPPPETSRTSTPTPTRTRQELEEASFLVVESGRIRFLVRPRVEVEVPTCLEDVQRFSFTLEPRNRGVVRRVSVGKKRLPDTRVRERAWAYVDRVGSVAHVVSDLGPRRYTTRTRGVRSQAGVIEVARGTYAITSHRDHAHLMYELDIENSGISATLVRQLRIVPRASYIAAVFNPESRWRVSDRERPDVDVSEPAWLDEDRFGKRRFTALDPVFLDHEGTELVLVGGGQPESRDDPGAWARS